MADEQKDPRELVRVVEWGEGASFNLEVTLGGINFASRAYATREDAKRDADRLRAADPLRTLLPKVARQIRALCAELELLRMDDDVSSKRMVSRGRDLLLQLGEYLPADKKGTDDGD